MKKIFVFFLLLLALTVYFSLTAIFQFKNDFPHDSLLIQYYFLYYSFFTKQPVYFIIFLLVLNLITFTYLLNIFSGSLFKKILKSIFSLLTLLFIAFHLSLYMLYFFAFIHINIYSQLYNKGIFTNQITTDIYQIKTLLTKTKTAPEIAYRNFSYKKNVVLLGLKNGNLFYEEKILSGFPDNYFNNIAIPAADIILVNNTLLISRISEDGLEVISPSLAKRVITKAYPQLGKKPEPQIVVLNKKNYVSFRNKQLKNQEKKIDNAAQDTNKQIEIYLGYVSQNKHALTENISIRNERVQLYEKQLDACKKAGKTDPTTNTIKRSFTDEVCLKNHATRMKTLEKIDNTIQEITEAVKKNERQILDLNSYKNSLLATKKALAQSGKTTQYELGLFLSEQNATASANKQQNSIHIALSDGNDTVVITTFFSTLIHEYLHYESFISPNKQLDPFFEEALTEYFARSVLQKQNDFISDAGYPVAYRIMREFAKKIPDEKLLKIYVTKDQKELESALNKTYGKNFYNEIASYLTTLNYLPLDKAIETANVIMSRIEGKTLRGDDFYLVP